MILIGSPDWRRGKLARVWPGAKLQPYGPLPILWFQIQVSQCAFATRTSQHRRRKQNPFAPLRRTEAIARFCKGCFLSRWLALRLYQGTIFNVTFQFLLVFLFVLFFLGLLVSRVLQCSRDDELMISQVSSYLCVSISRKIAGVRGSMIWGAQGSLGFYHFFLVPFTFRRLNIIFFPGSLSQLISKSDAIECYGELQSLPLLISGVGSDFKLLWLRMTWVLGNICWKGEIYSFRDKCVFMSYSLVGRNIQLQR